MKYFKILIPLFFLTVVFQFSCEKEVVNVESVKLIKSEFQYYSDSPSFTDSSWVDYEYDDKRRLLHINISELEDNASCSYIYEGNKVIMECIYPSSPFPDSILRKIYFLNSKGFADSLVYDGGFEIEEYVYDIENHLTKIIHRTPSYITYEYRFFYDSNGNLEKSIEVFDQTGSIRTCTYSYYSDLVNEISDYNKGISFLGKSSANLISGKITEFSNNELTIFQDFYYSRNGEGCISKMTQEEYTSNDLNQKLTYNVEYSY